jgi:hypothetical protein
MPETEDSRALARCPRIDELEAKVLEMTCVTGGKRCPSGGDDARDLEVADVERLPGCSTLRAPNRSFRRSIVVERKNPILEVFFDGALERVFELSAPPPGCEQFETEPNLKNCYSRGPQRLRRLPVQPCHNGRIGLALHERRDYVGVEHRHLDLNTAGLGRVPRSSSISSSSPIFLNRALMRVPRGTAATSSKAAALRRISRTSSSMLRPCRLARRRSRVFTLSSRFLTTS